MFRLARLTNPIRHRIVCTVLVCGITTIAIPRQGDAQTVFDSGSTGADGALNITTPGLTYFDPSKIPNHRAGDTIFNFTTINIASGSTIRLDARYMPGPVYWLASGDVNIAGMVDLSGTNGSANTTDRVNRGYAIPGAGGYSGGPGGSLAVGPGAGAGPGGGKAGVCGGAAGDGGTFSGSQYLIPLVGGSGGGGGCGGTTICGGGGAGGGAILIASSTKITLLGQISAVGGSQGSYSQCQGAGFGSGGAVRLASNTIFFGPSGTVNVSAYPGSNNGTSGFARLEAYQLPSGGAVIGSYTTSTPLQLVLPVTGPPVVQIATVNGIAVNSNHFVFPDVTINTTQSVPVVISGQNVPVGTVPTLYILSESGPDQIVTAPPLQGTLQSSSSTLNIVYPSGGSVGIIRATWAN